MCRNKLADFCDAANSNARVSTHASPTLLLFRTGTGKRAARQRLLFVTRGRGAQCVRSFPSIRQQRCFRFSALSFLFFCYSLSLSLAQFYPLLSCLLVFRVNCGFACPPPPRCLSFFFFQVEFDPAVAVSVDTPGFKQHHLLT